MANQEHVELLTQGVEAWNTFWRRDEHLHTPIDLSGADLCGLDLTDIKLTSANLRNAKLRKTTLKKAHLPGADLRHADLTEADLSDTFLAQADLDDVNLTRATLDRAFLFLSKARRADLSGARCTETNFDNVDLTGAILSGGHFVFANFHSANLTHATLRTANLEGALLIRTDFTDADLSGSTVYAASAWDLVLLNTKQQSLVITPDKDKQPQITVDNIEVAQFIYLILNNQKLRAVIDTITSKTVLILGRFVEPRKAVLDAIRERLRDEDLLPILFDFSVPASRDVTETVTLLARMARFIVADLTEPSSIPKELEAIVPHVAVPVQPLLARGKPYAMFADYWKYHWVLPVYYYDEGNLEALLASLKEKVIGPAEAKVRELTDRRRDFEAQLLNQRSSSIS